MSLLDRFRKGQNVPANATFRLTQVGNERLQEFRGDAKSRILIALEAEGSSGVNDIAINSGLNKGQVERLIPSLIRGGYVQYVSGSVMGENRE